MHNSNKIDQLHKFLEDDPEDTFTLYALALEYDKINDEKAKVYYGILLDKYPDYLATYYHAGKYYEKVNRQEVERIYLKGMEVAKNKGNHKTYNEIQNALNLFRDEEYD